MKPESATILANGEREQVKLPCSVADFVAGHGWKTTQVVVEFNGRVLQRDEFGRTMLCGGEQLEIIVPVAGG
jgi:thiamine biosynthesis protein ThiS